MLPERERLGHTAAGVQSESGLSPVELPGSQEAPPAAALAVTVAELDATRALVGVTGELDLAVTGTLTDVLNGQLAAGRRVVLLDLSDLEFCSCAGLGALLANRSRFRDAGGALTLVGAPDCLKRLVQLTGANEILSAREWPERLARPEMAPDPPSGLQPDTTTVSRAH
jgi:anti-anti-sigma factor